MTEPDGSVCVGCEHIGMFNNTCKKNHSISHFNGCSKCGTAIRFDVMHKHFSKVEKCEDYEMDGNYWSDSRD